MQTTTIEAGATYRLVHDLEVRSEATGTLKVYLRKGTLLTIKRVDHEMNHAWAEGMALPLPLDVLPRHLETA